jgi:hypothetical protein
MRADALQRFDSAAHKQLAVAALQQRLKGGAGWFYAIAALSLLNSVAFYKQDNWSFFIGLAITQIIDGAAMGLSSQLSDQAAWVPVAIALFFDISTAALFVFFGIWAGRGRLAFFVAGMALYGLDALIVAALGDILSTGFHAFALYGLFGGYVAAKHLRRLSGESPSLREPARVHNEDEPEKETFPLPAIQFFAYQRRRLASGRLFLAVSAPGGLHFLRVGNQLRTDRESRRATNPRTYADPIALERYLGMDPANPAMLQLDKSNFHVNHCEIRSVVFRRDIRFSKFPNSGTIEFHAHRGRKRTFILLGEQNAEALLTELEGVGFCVDLSELSPGQPTGVPAPAGAVRLHQGSQTSAH